MATVAARSPYCILVPFNDCFLCVCFLQTVNTAARMESNGQKGRIQVSQQTADCLLEAGKGSWIKPREDKIEAKGKGLLQCYWLDPKLDNLFSSSSSSSTNHNNKVDQMSMSCVTHSRRRGIDDTEEVTTSTRRTSF